MGFFVLFGGIALGMALWAAKPQRDMVSSHHPSGTNFAVRPFEKGRAARAWVTWYEDRWRASESYFEGGQRVGLWHQFGRPFRGADGEGRQADLVRAEFEADELHGPFVRHFADGRVRELGRYTEGLRHGMWIAFEAPGAEAQSEHYWRGHHLGADSEALFETLEADPPADLEALEQRIESAVGSDG